MAGKNLFNSIKVQKHNSNSFDLSHDVKGSYEMGKLYPVMTLEALPGDKFNISCESLLRFSPLVAPVMHRMDVTIHYFFVPNRLLWPNWERWIVDPNSSVAPPSITLSASMDKKSLANHLGLPDPKTVAGGMDVSAFPFAAYQCIYNEYYRDQNLVTAVDFELLDGLNNLQLDLYPLRRRAWEHDYFTSALPFAQQAAAIDIPIVLQDAPIAMSDAGIPGPGFIGIQSTFGPGATNINVAVKDSSNLPDNVLFADNSAVGSSTTINDLRRSIKLQEWLEKAIRGGTRYIESILSHFGVKSSDARLNRPEYITGTKSPVVISEVLNTTGDTTATTPLPQGNMAGHAISVTAGKYGNYYCEEHGWIMGIMSVMPKAAYQQGIPRHFLKGDPLDYYWPSFAHIGEQEIQNKELYVEHSNPGGTFGYIPRYAEYKFQSNRVVGDFQDTLNHWHLGRDFVTEPDLNKLFIECNPSRRIFAVTDPLEDIIYAHFYHKVRALRKMPVFGTPSF